MTRAASSGVTMRIVDARDDGLRLDRWFRSHYPALGHGALEKMLRKGQIRVAGSRVKANFRVSAGDEIRVPPDVPPDVPGGSDEHAPATRRPKFDERRDQKANAAFISNLIIFEDDDIMVLNKPAGIAVQGGTNTTRHIDGMLASMEKNGERPRLVHRLDRDTSGVLLLAKSRIAAAKLGGAFQRHEVDKTYWALTAATPRPREGTIDAPLSKQSSADGHERMAQDDRAGSKKAITDFQLIDAAGDGVAFLALRPRTGRTHQLRVHCAMIEAPIVGDGKYGGAAAKIHGVARGLHLHCRSMRFPHPRTGRVETLVAPLEGHMKQTWKFFAFDQSAEVSWPDLFDVKARKR